MAQMTRCPLTGLTCGKAIIVQEKAFFLSEPEKPEGDRERRWKAIKAALGNRYQIQSALSEKLPIAFSCKICEMIQCCAYGMADISTQNPNVLLELGMMFALGKPAIILCKRGQEEQLKLPSNLNAIEVVPFQDHIDIIDDLRRIAATLPPPAVPPTPISEIENLRPSLAEELRGQSDATVKEFDTLIKQAKLDSIAPRDEKVDMPPALETRLGNVEESLKRLERLGFAPDEQTAFNRGNFYYNKEEYDAALEQYDWAVRLNPDNSQALYDRGTTYIKLGRYDEALLDLNKALELRPHYPAALYNMACLFSLMPKPDNAISYLEKAIGMVEKYRQDAATDANFDNIRDDPRFRKLIEGT